ncbi:MAG: DNA-3-methyladenine glycosylase [Candidatus Heimdallarchaeota archaeon]|nr:DNA-3-methyladenine glycosylase [Candidatus Heimdallarchaeota archaeon]
MELKKLERSFYRRNTLTVAGELLGKYLVHNSGEGTTIGMIVETEAYIGPEDKAAHSYKGRRTNRTEVMFGPPGQAYVYLIYGIHFCFNIITNEKGKPEAVLIRALEPVKGLDLMRKRRGFSEITKKNKPELTNGPGKLCNAMGIDKSLYGADLTGEKLFLAYPPNRPDFEIASTPRINIDYAEEAIDYPWRFLIKGNHFVSNL